MTKGRVRRLERSDMAEAAKLFRASFNDRLPWLADRHTPDEDAWFWGEILFPRYDIFGVETGERLAGVLALHANWIEQLYVMPDQQARGIGSRLLDIAKRSSNELSLATFLRNVPARRFYEAKGFRATEFRDGSDNEEREPDVLYEWKLAENA